MIGRAANLDATTAEYGTSEKHRGVIYTLRIQSLKSGRNWAGLYLLFQLSLLI